MTKQVKYPDSVLYFNGRSKLIYHLHACT